MSHFHLHLRCWVGWGWGSMGVAGPRRCRGSRSLPSLMAEVGQEVSIDNTLIKVVNICDESR